MQELLDFIWAMETVCFLGTLYQLIYSENSMDYSDHLTTALQAAFKAGQAILDIYNSDIDFDIETKSDNSPLTIADKRSHSVIIDCLNRTIPSSAGTIPILSEEGTSIPYIERKDWGDFWLIDPLDGTREFIKRNGEFTVNIALIHDSGPFLGVVYVPVKDTMYYACKTIGAYKLVNCGLLMVDGKEKEPLDTIISNSQKLPATVHHQAYTVMASRSHMNTDTENFISSLKKQHGEIKVMSAGSSLKLCQVAEGIADMYPRLGPTMEWDTAAAHAIVRAAGKMVAIFNSDEELTYNKENLLNPWFVVS